MKRKLSIGQNTWRILYMHVQPYLFPGLVVMLCFTIFVVFIIPQMQDLFHAKDEEKTLQKNIVVLQNNATFLNNLDDSVLNSQYALVSSALPSDKDFLSVINTVAGAAAGSSVQLDDYSFQVGKLSTSSAELKETAFSLNLVVKGTPDNTRNFLYQLSQRLPLSTILTTDEKFQSNQDTISIAINFFYKPLSAQTLDVHRPLLPLSKSDTDLIHFLQSLGTNVQNNPTVLASPSSIVGTNLTPTSISQPTATPISSTSAVPTPTVVSPTP